MKIRILNPIYDSVFTKLLENNYVAKGIVERITKQKIEKLTALPTKRAKLFEDKKSEKEFEKLTLTKKYQIPIYRLDFVAKIKTQSGEYEHLVIEMQKSSVTPHLARFRQYLGDELRRKVEVEQEDGTFKERFLPITTIYFIEKSFDKKLPPILLADKTYYDVLNNKPFEKNVGKLVKCLTNKAFFIQTTNLPQHLKGDYELLNSFSNHLVIDIKDDRVLEIPYKDIDNIKDPLYREMIKILQGLVGDETLKKEMRDIKIYEDYLDEIELKLRKKDNELEQKKQEIEQQTEIIKKLKQQLKSKN